MRITRLLSLSASQFSGCVSAFVDALTGELNAAALHLRKLENRPKGSAFAFEMALDQHRYGALVILDRWGQVLQAFGPHLAGGEQGGLIADSAAHIASAETILARANDVLDAAGNYHPEVVEACLAAWQSATAAFREERALAEKSAQLGPMLPEEYREARRIFAQDLAAR